MTNESVKFYVALMAGMWYVAIQHREKTRLARVAISAISGAIGYSTSSDIAVWLGYSPILVVMVVTAFSYAFMDIAGAILADRATVLKIVKSRLGVK